MALYVRSLTIREGQYLQKILRTSKDRSKLRRAQVILCSEQGLTVQQIAKMTFLHEEYIRELIRRFNRQGLDIFQSRPRPGRPVEFDEELRTDIVQCALSPPRLLRQPFSRWTLPKLRDYVIGHKIVQHISLDTLQRILKQAGVRLQRTKTWKESNDPHFESKKNA